MLPKYCIFTFLLCLSMEEFCLIIHIWKAYVCLALCCISNCLSIRDRHNVLPLNLLPPLSKKQLDYKRLALYCHDNFIPNCYFTLNFVFYSWKGKRLVFFHRKNDVPNILISNIDCMPCSFNEGSKPDWWRYLLKRERYVWTSEDITL